MFLSLSHAQYVNLWLSLFSRHLCSYWFQSLTYKRGFGVDCVALLSLSLPVCALRAGNGVAIMPPQTVCGGSVISDTLLTFKFAVE